MKSMKFFNYRNLKMFFIFISSSSIKLFWSSLSFHYQNMTLKIINQIKIFTKLSFTTNVQLYFISKIIITINNHWLNTIYWFLSSIWFYSSNKIYLFDNTLILCKTSLMIFWDVKEEFFDFSNWMLFITFSKNKKCYSKNSEKEYSTWREKPFLCYLIFEIFWISEKKYLKTNFPNSR